MHHPTRSPVAVPIACMLLSLATAPLAAQGTSAVSGRVQEPTGRPIAGADVFLLETLEGAPTDSAGTYHFTTHARGPVTLVVQRSGYLEVRRQVELPLDGSVSIVMQQSPVALKPITVEAGTYRLGNLPDVTLSELDVVRTPGSAADPFRAIQTFPGLQSVGDGAGLFVRGGDVAETRVLLDGATVISPFRLDTDRTISFGRFDPFMLKGVQFSAGGFGAEYGDALSAVADLQTVDRPTANELDLTAAIGALSGRLHLGLSEAFGVRAAATYTNTGPLMRLNGRRDEFDQVPESTDLSGGFEWAYRDGASLKSFAMFQTDRVGVRIDDPGYTGIYRSDAGADLVAFSGRDVFGTLGVLWGVATSGSTKDEDFGAFRLEREDRLTQVRAKVEVPLRRGVALAAGVELEDRAAELAGSVPVASHDNAPDAAQTVFASRENGTRLGAFGEIELQPSNTLRLLLGARADRSTFTGRVTADPRVSATYRPGTHLTFTTAWGVFHQVPDPLVFEPTLGDPTLPSMAARHVIAGMTYGNGNHLIRFEAWHKRYESLAARTRDAVTRGQGTGDARGLDLFIKEDLGLLGLTGRLAYSFIDSKRTDPDSGALALLEEAQSFLERSIEIEPIAESHALLSSALGMRITSDADAMTLGMQSGTEMGRARALGPRNPRVRLLEGISAFHTPEVWGGGHDAALAHFQAAIEFFADDAPRRGLPAWGLAEAYAWLGQTYTALGKAEEARGAYERALEVEPEYAWVRDSLLPGLEG